MRHPSLKIIVFMLFIITGLYGQNLSIQGVARDNTGQSLPDGSYGFTFRLYSVATGGSVAWTENQNLDVLNGVFSAVLGDVVPMEGLDFNLQYWMSLEIDGNGELDPRTKLILSPYAVIAGLSGVDNVVPQSGNVGFGTTSPISILHVKNGTSSTRLTLERDGLEDETFLQYRTAGENKVLIGMDNSSTNLAFYSYGGPSTMAAFNTETGNFGLGTTPSSERLHVSGSSIFEIGSSSTDVDILPGLTIANTARSGGNQIAGNRTKLAFRQWMSWNDYVDAGAIITGNNTTNYTDGYMAFHTMNESAGMTEKMRITTSGDVGVGESAPSAKLDVAGTLEIDAWNSQNLSANGYVQMGGLIFQWGEFECTVDGSQSEDFSISFPTACFGVYSNRKEVDVESPITVNSWTRTSFTVNRENGIAGSQTVNWFAVGH